MKRTFLMTGLAVLTLAFFMTGCNSMKKLQKEVIETAVVGYVNPEQLESVNGVVNFNYTINFAPKQFDKKMILKITPKIQYGSWRGDFRCFTAKMAGKQFGYLYDRGEDPE